MYLFAVSFLRCRFFGLRKKITLIGRVCPSGLDAKPPASASLLCLRWAIPKSNLLMGCEWLVNSSSTEGVQESYWKGPRCSKLAFFQEKGQLCGSRLKEKDPVSQSLSVRKPMALSVFLMRIYWTLGMRSCWWAVKRGLMDSYLFNLRKK